MYRQRLFFEDYSIKVLIYVGEIQNTHKKFKYYISRKIIHVCLINSYLDSLNLLFLTRTKTMYDNFNYNNMNALNDQKMSLNFFVKLTT